MAAAESESRHERAPIAAERIEAHTGAVTESYQTASLNGSSAGRGFGTPEGLTLQERKVDETRTALETMRKSSPDSPEFKESAKQIEDLAKGHAQTMADFQKYMVDLQQRLGQNSDKLTYDENRVLADVAIDYGPNDKKST